MAIVVDETVMHNKQDRWIGNPMKERKLKRALRHVVGDNYERFDELFELIKARYEYH